MKNNNNNTFAIGTLLLMPALIFMSACSQPQEDMTLPTLNTSSPWYVDGAARVLDASQRSVNNNPGSAKNIILFIGDGMSVTTVTAARIYAGQLAGLAGEENQLSFEKFPWTGLSKTYNTNQQTPDSAGTMTAMMTGIKTSSGVIGIDSQPLRGDCESYFSSNEPNLMTALQLAEIAGMATGIVSTARITHATPAATYANAASRGWESSSNISEEDKALGCIDIAQQLIEFEHNLEMTVNQGQDHANIDGIDVVFGGGRAAFFADDPNSLTGFAESAEEGNRDDNRNLINEWTQSGGSYIMDQEGFDNIDIHSPANILGLFSPSHMRYERNRNEDINGEPSLTEMTTKAIEILEQDDEGFFLMVEAGRIDHAHHVNSAFNALNETVELSSAVAAAFAATDPSETLIIVTADHSHVMTMAGYPTRGNPILGKVTGNDANGNPLSEPAKDANELPYTSLSYANGSGFAQYGDETNADFLSDDNPPVAGRADLTNVDTEAPGYHQEVLVDMGGETHSSEDVAIYASGPGAHLISGVIEQNVIYHVMNFAGNLEKQAIEALK